MNLIENLPEMSKGNYVMAQDAYNVPDIDVTT